MVGSPAHSYTYGTVPLSCGFSWKAETSRQVLAVAAWLGFPLKSTQYAVDLIHGNRLAIDNTIKMSIQSICHLPFTDLVSRDFVIQSIPF